MRVFFAALPDPDTTQRIAALARALELGAASTRTPPGNYHMTLAFAGEVPERQIAALREIGGAQRACGFTVRLDALEYWPNARAVVAAARNCPASLEGLWRELHTGLARQQLALDPLPLRPHVTIARKVSQAPVFQAMSAFDWTVGSIHLMRSVTSAAGPVYTVVDTWALLDEAATP